MRLIGGSLMTVACLVPLITGAAFAADESRDRDSNASLKGKFRFSVTKSCTDTDNRVTGASLHLWIR